MFSVVDRKNERRAGPFLSSLVLQVAIVLLLLIIGKTVTPKMKVRMQPTSLTYVETVHPVVKLTAPPVTRAKLAVIPAPIPSPSPALPEPPPPAPAVKVPAIQPAPPPVAKPAPAPVFEATVAPVRAPSRPVVNMGRFAEPTSAPSATKRSVVAVNAFGTDSMGSVAKSQGKVVADVGFGTETSVAGKGSVHVQAASFGDVSTSVASGKGSVHVQHAGFGDVSEAAKAGHTASVAVTPKTTPVLISAKAAPEYTAEARRLHIEGEVVVDVIFHANGTIQVVRVVQGLGHGLDEAALAAASRVRFVPSTRDGQPVDVHTTLHIVFQLT
jgi:TonB family protein